MSDKRRPRFYPLFLNLTGRLCKIVGGGEVAVRKALDLLSAGAEVTVIAPRLAAELDSLQKSGRVRWIRKAYETGDLKDAFLVIIAMDDPEASRRASEEAIRVTPLVNVVDRPKYCSFIVPAVVNQGRLSIAISTGGAGPALSRVIREDLETVYGEEYAEFLDLMAEYRPKILAAVASNRRKELFYAVTRSEILQLFREGRREEARIKIESIIADYQD